MSNTGDTDFIARLLNYAENHSTPENPLLARLNRETHLKSHMPQMLSGHLQGSFLRVVSLMLKPRLILEIGTFTGYSAICLAAGLTPGGRLHSIEINPELNEFASRYIQEAGLSDQILLHTGDARDILPGIEGPFDLVFIDADKENYIYYLEMALKNLAPQGWILADNTLWYGRMLDSPADDDRETAGIRVFNDYVISLKEIEVLLLPLRDGLSLIRKKQII